MNNILTSYLVSLGFTVDQPELNKFKTALKDAGTTAERHTSGIIGQFVKWQTAIVGAFSAVGIATIGMMDKFAQADLQMQITAQRMFLPLRVARELSNTLDILGISLRDAMWNPEARGRIPGIMAEMRILEDGLGPGFEKTMMQIRSVSIEFRTWKKTLEYIGMRLSAGLFNALGGEAFLAKIRGWTDWLIKHAPQISDWLVRVLVPILKDAKRVLEDVWKVVEALARAFIRLIGAISGDDKLKQGALTFDNLGKAIDKAADYMVRFVDAMTSAVLVATDLFNVLVDLMHLDFKSAWGDAKSAGHDLTGGGAAVLGTGIIGAILGAKTIGGLGKILGGAARAGAGGVVEGAGAAGALGGLGSVLSILGLAGLAQYLSRNDDLGPNTYAGKELAWENKFAPLRWLNSLRGDKSQNQSVDSNTLASAVAWAESGGHQIDPRTGRITRSGAGALGIMQLMPETAAKLGVNPFDENQNMEGGKRLLTMLLKKYGNVREALAAYNWGEGRLDAALRRHGGQFALDYLPRETQDYIRRIEGHLGSGVQVAINAPITIHSTNATPEQIRGAVRDGTEDALRKVQRTQLLNAQGVYA